MEMKIPAIAIAAVVVVIVLAGVLMPVLDDTMATEETFRNKGYFTMDLVEEDTNTVITWSTTTPKVIEINGTTVDMSTYGTSRAYTLVGSDSFVVRYLDNGTDVFLQAYGSIYSSVISNNPNALTVTITVTDGQVLWDVNSDPAISNTYTYSDECYIINPTGDGDHIAIMKDANTPAFVKGDSKITFVGSSITDYSSAIALYGSGSIDEGVSISTLYKPNNISSVTYSTPVITSSEVSGYKDLYSLDKIQFAINYDASTYNATYSYFIVPYEVTAEKSVHFTDNQNAIFAAIPIMVIVALLLAVVAVIFRSRQF